MLRLRNQLLPLVNLGELLQLDTGQDETAEAAQLYIVVAQVGSFTLGIIVDRVFDIEEIVVKPVAPILRDITMFSGNTILGDGSVIMILDPNGVARACGLGGNAESRTGASNTAEAPTAAGPGSRAAILLFRAGGDDIKAVRLGLVARLEDVAGARIESAGGRHVTQYRGRLMPLLPLSGVLDTSLASQCVLVFADTGRSGGEADENRSAGGENCVGLVVDEILDVVEDSLEIQLGGEQPGLLGTAVIAGRATDMIDTEYWLEQTRCHAGYGA